MSMLLTISQPSRSEFGSRFTHDFSPRTTLAQSRLSPKPRVDTPVSSLRVSSTPGNGNSNMTGHHRGLPPPSAMTLPDPIRQGPPPPMVQPLGSMPAPPTQWHGQEESMRYWLAAKTEEDKRKQEEEKSRQESLRLEQRKIEQSMLRESLQGGVPPTMVPMIYAGIGGPHLANVSLDWLQQYAGQLQATQQQIQQQQPSPDLRREARLIGPAPSSYAVAQAPHPQVVPSQHVEQPKQPAPLQTTFSAYAPSAPRQAPTSAPRSATHTQLPRLTTNDMYIHNPPQQQGPGSAHPLQQSQTIQQDQPTSSPSIYFHHWVPPNEAKGNNPPATPASKGEPHSAHPGSHLSESDYKESPRKRKAHGGHERNPPPSNTSPPSLAATSFNSGRKSGHTRSRSNTSAGRDSEGRPDSRRETERPRSSQLHPSSNSSEEHHQTRPPSRPQEEPSSRSSAELQRELKGERPS